MARTCYIAVGAKMQCSKGNDVIEIKLSQSHGSYVNNKPMMVATDRNIGSNIGCFGECEGEKCCPIITDNWIKVKDDMIIKGRPALTMDSILVCGKGGVITFVTDGQE